MSLGRTEHKSSDTKPHSSSHHSDDEYESDEESTTPAPSQKKSDAATSTTQVKSVFAISKPMEVEKAKTSQTANISIAAPAPSPAKPPEAPFGTNLTFFNHQKHFVHGNPAISKHSKQVQQQDFGTYTRDHKSDVVLTHVFDDKGNIIAERHYTVTETILKRPSPTSKTTI